ncbi:hypothetical protein ES319_A08G136000v1 [Gossypium barbadense]|uniref:Uncharacterized protein n=3 Tax=Gossypium TaxID=3633 RepID=A0A5J5URH3_GOSBA|nr:hypothetical protein ES319_A08G136000v1 [Gossypium barbadense]TYH06344.1 hypothetical protein ES288_A08G149200v1 [Gossypium darwinii]TYI14850.1 hypothetical protein ES332_A08G149800v1 [Gossypium tomentosum]KAB2070098.1 hypothetical protein ES319_A08G136000v1 [Gossypium barbadense]KAB2070099.1 hypothetical protein ES319_A08G136000v1 [Gossypium barbadense]
MLMWRMECPGNLFQLKERWESSLEKVLLLFILLKTEVQNITGVSTYNVTPMKVFFYIDPEFETDARMDAINNLILSYTFFKVSEK